MIAVPDLPHLLEHLPGLGQPSVGDKVVQIPQIPRSVVRVFRHKVPAAVDQLRVVDGAPVRQGAVFCLAENGVVVMLPGVDSESLDGKLRRHILVFVRSCQIQVCQHGQTPAPVFAAAAALPELGLGVVKILLGQLFPGLEHLLDPVQVRLHACVEQLVQGHAKNGAQFRQQGHVRAVHVVFPLGNGLGGDAQQFGEPLLGQILPEPEGFDAFSEIFHGCSPS